MRLQYIAKYGGYGRLRGLAGFLACQQVIRDCAGNVSLRQAGAVDRLQVCFAGFDWFLIELNQRLIQAINYVFIV